MNGLMIFLFICTQVLVASSKFMIYRYPFCVIIWLRLHVYNDEKCCFSGFGWIACYSWVSSFSHIDFLLLSGVLPKYFHSEWSVAQFRLHEGEQYIVAFGHEKNIVAVVGMDGRYVHQD